MMNAQIAALILAFTGNAAAYWRMPCAGVAGVARIDPIVDNGKLAAHMHTIKGGNALSTACTAEELLASKCASCQIRQDKSAYWTPQLYFMHDSGEVEAVGETGHVTYYKYAPSYVNGEIKDPVAMPNGLRIVSGDTLRRNFTLPVPDPDISTWTGEQSTQDALSQKAIGFNCLNYGAAKPEDTLYRHFMPDKAFLDSSCPDGLRFEVLFPYCWNGKDLDSDDHKSHMAFPSSGQNGGNCPEGYDTVVNQILFETIYPTQNYADKSGYFSLSNGDPTGFGYHGDLFVAWDEGVLKEATEKCGNPLNPPYDGQPTGCSVFDIVPDDEQQECKIEVEGELEYNMKSPAKALPGSNPIQKGPERATKAAGNASPVTAHPTSLGNTLVPTLSFSEGHSGGFTDKLGNIFKQEKSTAPSAPAPSAKAQDSYAANTPEAANEPAKVETTSTSSAPAAGEAKATPPAVAAEIPAGGYVQQGEGQAGLPAVTTIYETSGHAVYEKVIVQTDVTVTGGSAAPTPAAKKQRRHAHHLHQHQQGGRFARR